MYTSDDFIEFVELISTAKNPLDILIAWRILKAPYSSLRVITALPDYTRNVIFPGVDIRDLSGGKVVTPYFSNDSLYFSSRATIEKTIMENEIKIPLDGSIMLDTNIASYISTYINRRPFNGKNQQEIVNLIHQILEKNPNFDYIYYMIENSKDLINKYQEKDAPNCDIFWEELNDGLKENLISLKLFLSIDNKKFQLTGNDSPTISALEAEKEAKDFAYEFYFNKNEFLENKIYNLFTYAKILLYKMTYINFKTNEGYKKKSIEFIQFMLDELNIYFDREMHLAVKYFQEGNKFSFFQKIEKGKNFDASSIKKKIENMAWDLIIPRHVESLSGNFGNGQYFIPHYLTWDKGLNASLNIYKAKACIYDDSLGRVVTIPEADTKSMLLDAIGKYHVDKYFDPDVVKERYTRVKLSKEDVQGILNKTESDLFSIMKK